MDNIYRDIAGRTGGDIYIGVVGPVRTGKSTFIKKFMEALVLPNIEGEYDRRRARDEMPQSGAGKAVMTTEPKFIPDEAVNITVDGDATLRVKMVDCVGYIVPDATGQTENGEPRMVLTPWSASPMPFPAAAEMGTRKVITDHATIGVVVTTDGSIGDIPRESYADAERRVVEELRSIAKPFAIVLNSADPAKPEAEALAYELESRYGVPVALVNCLELNADDIRHILELILLEFPVTEISVGLPRWTAALEADHWLSASLRAAVLECAGKITRTGDIRSAFAPLAENENIESARVSKLDLSSGQAELDIKLDEGLYYRVMSELTGFSIPNEEELISLMRRLAEIKTAYDKVAGAL
ncbi:MAG: stage IV sporulation protein A, partial [Eubacteriales bacterium]